MKPKLRSCFLHYCYAFLSEMASQTRKKAGWDLILSVESDWVDGLGYVLMAHEDYKS